MYVRDSYCSHWSTTRMHRN